MATSNTTPVVIPQPIAAQATSENINVIPNGATGTNGASFQEGFPAITRMPVIENPLPTQKSGLPPKQQDFNGLFNVVSQHNFFSQNGGTYSFNQAVSDAIGGYPKNAVLWYFPENEDPFFVYSLINNNTHNFVEDPTLIDDEHWKKLSFGGGGEIGDVMFVPLGIDESLNLRRYLNGQVISQSQFVSFTNKVKAAIALYPNLATTEENWQAEKTNSKLGQCGKFVVNDTAGTIRLPCVVNAQGLVDLALIGGIKNESLPNITGSFRGGNDISGTNASGAFYDQGTRGDSKSYTASAGREYYEINFGFAASRSSSAYKDNAPVQQEAVQYPYCIQVATGVEETLPAIREYKINTPFFFGQSMYSDIAPDNASWLVSNGQYNARYVYPDYYDWLVEQRNTGIKTFYLWHSSTDQNMLLFYTETNALSVGTTIYGYMPVIAIGEITVISGNDVTIRNDVTNQTYTSSVDVANPTTSSFYLYDRSKINVISKTELDAWDFPINTSDYDFVINTTDQTFRLPLKNGQEGVFADNTVPSGWNLYYYVGDTVQDASLINAGAVLGQLATKTNSVEAAVASMPSSRYIDLTLGASGSTYTAPANGWVAVGGSCSGYLSLYNDTGKLISILVPDNASYKYARTFVPVSKGDVFGVDYLGLTVDNFLFIYAKGEQ